MYDYALITYPVVIAELTLLGLITLRAKVELPPKVKEYLIATITATVALMAYTLKLPKAPSSGFVEDSIEFFAFMLPVLFTLVLLSRAVHEHENGKHEDTIKRLPK